MQYERTLDSMCIDTLRIFGRLHTPKQIPLAFVRGIDAEEEKTEGDSVALVITLCSTSFTVRRNFADRLSYSVQTTDIRDAQARSRTTFDFSIFMLKLRMDGNIRRFIHERKHRFWKGRFLNWSKNQKNETIDRRYFIYRKKSWTTPDVRLPDGANWILTCSKITELDLGRV